MVFVSTEKWQLLQGLAGTDRKCTRVSFCPCGSYLCQGEVGS